MNIVLLANQTAAAINIAKYIKNSQEIMDKSEQKLKLAELIETLANIKMEIADVKSTLLEKDEEILKLKEELKLKEDLIYEQPYYWIKKEDSKDGPYCQNCYDFNKSLIRLQELGTGFWECFSCTKKFKDKNYTSISHTPELSNFAI